MRGTPRPREGVDAGCTLRRGAAAAHAGGTSSRRVCTLEKTRPIAQPGMHIVLRNCDGAVAYDLRQHEHITTSSFS